MPDPYHIAFQSINSMLLLKDCAILIQWVLRFSDETNDVANAMTHSLPNCCIWTIQMANHIMAVQMRFLATGYVATLTSTIEISKTLVSDDHSATISV